MDAVHPAELPGRQVLLLGLGSFGGGAGCARVLIEQGARLTVTDLRNADQLGEGLATLRGLPFRSALGGHHEELFAGADFVVVNPAVPPTSEWLQVARRHGCKLTTEVNLALALAAEVPAIAITGTHGKSTTAALCAHLAGGLTGTTRLGGNLGGSLLADVQGLAAGDRLIVELSSFQLERLHAPSAWPRVALLTCLGEDHLDRHLDFDDYAAAKQRVLAFQDAGCTLLLPGHGNHPAAPPAHTSTLAQWSAAARGRVERFRAADLAHHPLPQGAPCAEPYRQAALAAALRALQLLGGDSARLAPRACTFAGLPHRLQELPAPAGWRIIDNGVATHPEATAAALSGLDGPVHLIVGGQDKGLPLDALVGATTAEHHFYLHGAGGKRLAAHLHKMTPPTRPSDSIFTTFRDAAAAALAQMNEGATLLFSPSFSSFDEYRNFRDRASEFQEMCTQANFPQQREQVTTGLRRTNREPGKAP